MDIMELWSSYRKGADPEEIFSLYQECPLHEACYQNQSEVVEALLTGGADVNLVNNSQHSALYYATENGFTEIVEQLLMAGAEG